MNNFDRAMAYLKKLPAANSGSGGHNATLRAACECYRFGLSDAEALEAMQWFNQNLCNPAWSDGELKHKLNDAAKIVNAKGEKRAPIGKQSKTFVPPTVTVKRKAKPIIEQSYEVEEAWWARVFAERGITDPALEVEVV